jgi:glycine/D-amino acid oxidase-like deaminating enzyme
MSESADPVFWHAAGASTPRRSDRPQREHYDVVIVGGGYTGLSTALELSLAEPGIRVVVLERRTCGFGASGRNSGFLTPLVGHDLHTIHRRYGAERGGALASTGRDAVAHVEGLIERFGIECDYEATGLANPALSGSQLRRLDQQAKAAQALGVPCTTWDANACREALGVNFFRGALVGSDGGTLQPYALARGLMGAAVAAGAEVCEGIEVLDVDGDRGQVDLGDRMLTADQIVLATNAYTRYSTLKRRFAPLHVYTLVTEPLSEARKQEIGYHSRVGFYTLHHILWALRWTADDRLLIATGDVKYHPRDRLHVPSEAAYAKLRRGLRWFHPALADLDVTHRWEGVVGVTLDDLPVIGPTPGATKLWNAVAYCGHGVALACWAGTLMRDLVLGRENDAATLPFVGGARFPPVPGEPIRSPFAAAYIGLLRGLDAVANLGTPGRP